MKVALMGTCNDSTWREELIPMLEIDYFNPVVKDWTEKCMIIEKLERATCGLLLYYITPKMLGVYSIAEVTEDAIKSPDKTIFSFCVTDGSYKFNESQIKSLQEVGKLIKRNGGMWIESGNLKEVAMYINSFSEDWDH